MKLKLDENLGAGVAQILRTAGHDVATVPEQGLCSKPDETIIDVCRVEKRCLVTLDLGFSDPFRFNPIRYAGIAVLRLPRKREPGDIADTAATLSAGLAEDSIDGRLWIVERFRIRKYQPSEYE